MTTFFEERVKEKEYIVELGYNVINNFVYLVFLYLSQGCCINSSSVILLAVDFCNN